MVGVKVGGGVVVIAAADVVCSPTPDSAARNIALSPITNAVRCRPFMTSRAFRCCRENASSSPNYTPLEDYAKLRLRYGFVMPPHAVYFEG